MVATPCIIECMCPIHIMCTCFSYRHYMPPITYICLLLYTHPQMTRGSISRCTYNVYTVGISFDDWLIMGRSFHLCNLAQPINTQKIGRWHTHRHRHTHTHTHMHTRTHTHTHTHTHKTHRQAGRSRLPRLCGRPDWSPPAHRTLCIPHCPPSHWWHSPWPRCCRDWSSSRLLTKGQGEPDCVSIPGRWCRIPRWRPRERGFERRSGRRCREVGKSRPVWELQEEWVGRLNNFML